MDLGLPNIEKRLLLLILSLIGGFQVATIRPGMVSDEDSSLYLLHARNIAFGHPYNATGFIYSTESARYSPSAYPPVFPILLAPLFRFYGVNPGPYKILMVAMLTMCLFVVALYFRDKISKPWLVLLLVLLGCNPYVTELKNQVLSDLPFLFFVYAALLLFGDLQECRRTRTPSLLKHALFAGFFTYLAYGTRAVGLGIVVSMIAFSLIRYRTLTRLLVPSVVIFFLFAGLQSRLVSTNSDYLLIGMLHGQSPIENLHFYAGATSYLWDIGFGTFPRLIIFAVVTSLSLVGAWRHTERQLDPMTLFFAGYTALLLIWPVHQARYLLPLVPSYLYFFLQGLHLTKTIVSSHCPSAAAVMVTGVTGALLLGYAAKYAKSDFGPSPDAWDSKSSKELFAFIRESTPEGAIIVAGTPRAVALYTGRRAARFPEVLEIERLQKYIARLGATYLLASQSDGSTWASLCRFESGAQPAFSNSRYTLYKIALPQIHESQQGSMR